MMRSPDDDRSGTIDSDRPIIFGEVLFDRFPDDRQVLGGAPFNVAWNLRGLGFDPYFVSGIGDDESGQAVRQRMSSWGMNPSGLHTIQRRPTGTVSVSLENNQPSYEIVSDQAYDFVPPVAADELGERCPLLYHGSLIFRGERSHQTLQGLIADSGLPRFVDVNVRQPHFDLDWLPELLGGASWVKLNDEELAYLSGIVIRDQSTIEAAVNRLRESFGEATYFVTCGARGAYAVDHERTWFAPAPKPETFCDSVGAGDAFAAATIGGIIMNRSPGQALAAAARFASRVCGVAGGTSGDRSIYEETQI
jgi:fructokinase